MLFPAGLEPGRMKPSAPRNHLWPAHGVQEGSCLEEAELREGDSWPSLRARKAEPEAVCVTDLDPEQRAPGEGNIDRGGAGSPGKTEIRAFLSRKTKAEEDSGLLGQKVEKAKVLYLWIPEC